MTENHKHEYGDGWIGVDLDGTLAEYHGWMGPDHIGAPIMAMVDRVRRWLDKGKDVRIFTARVSAPPSGKADYPARAVKAIHAFCIEHFGRPLVVTNVKDYLMVELWDDRCVQVKYNDGTPIGDDFEG